MRPQQRSHALKLIGFGASLIALLVVLVLLRHRGIPDVFVAIGAVVCGVLGSVFYIQGCIALAEAKGHSGASVAAMIIVSYFCFFPLLPFIPLIAWFGLNDRYTQRSTSRQHRRATEPFAEKANAIPVKRWRWWVYFILTNFYPLSYGISGLFIGAASSGSSQLSPAISLLFEMSVEMLEFGLIFGLAFYLSRVTPEELLLRWRGLVKPLWLGAAYSVVLRFGTGLLIKLMFIILLVAGIMDTYQMLDVGAAHSAGVERIVSATDLRRDSAFFWLSMTFVSFIFAGLREELWRAAFFAGAKKLWPQTNGSNFARIGVAAFAAVVFGFGHTPQGALAVLQTGLIGFGFGLIMIFHRSIWPAVVAHGLFDATSMALMAYRNG